MDAIISRQGEFMQTFTGSQFWPVDPKPSEVDIRDIAHALSMQCRYAGHCLRFYSVAEHCVHLARFVSQENKLWALLHDASEAYLVDVPRPLKPYLPGYYEAEKRVMDVVAECFNLPQIMPSEVKNADNRILIDERRQNMWPATYVGGWPDVEPLGITLEFWDPAKAELYFLDTWKKLMRGEDL